MKHGKKYNDSVKLVDSTKQYDRDEALDLVVKTAKAKFDETVEVHIKLGVDGRHADQHDGGLQWGQRFFLCSPGRIRRHGFARRHERTGGVHGKDHVLR